MSLGRPLSSPQAEVEGGGRSGRSLVTGVPCEPERGGGGIGQGGAGVGHGVDFGEKFTSGQAAWPLWPVFIADAPRPADKTSMPLPAQTDRTDVPQPQPQLPGLRAVIVEDMALWADLVATVLEREGAQVVGRGTDVATAVAAVQQGQPDVVLLDLWLGRENGLEVLRQARAGSPRTKWILCTAKARPYTLRTALRLGAHGVVSKTGDGNEELIAAVRTVARGGEYYSKTVGKILAELIRLDREQELSDQEEQVLQGLGRGIALKEIAHAMGVEPGTAGKYLQRIREKWRLPPGGPVQAVLEEADRLGYLNRADDF